MVVRKIVRRAGIDSDLDLSRGFGVLPNGGVFDLAPGVADDVVGRHGDVEPTNALAMNPRTGITLSRLETKPPTTMTTNAISQPVA